MLAYLKRLHPLSPQHVLRWRYRGVLPGRRSTQRRSIAERKHWQPPASALRASVPTVWTTNVHNECQS
ncbi:MAG: hypothetical protein AAF730_06345 [Bacteroidota bacterium]